MGTIDSYFQEISGAFINSPVVERYRIRERLVGQREGFIRIRSWLVNGNLFEAFEFITLEEEAIVLQTYRLHWQDKTGRLIRRWDNAPHCPELESFPHHVHTSEGKAEPSRPIGIKKVLRLIEEEIR